jgi:hypothetical protein
MKTTFKTLVLAVLVVMQCGCCCYDRGWNEPCRRPSWPADWCWGDQCSVENRTPSVASPTLSTPSDIVAR